MNPNNPNADWVYPPAPNFPKSFWSPRPKADYTENIANDGVTIFEAKWEIDSLANFFRLAVSLAKASNRLDFVHNPTWKAAAQMALSAIRSQQRGTNEERTALRESLDRKADRAAPPIEGTERTQEENSAYNYLKSNLWMNWLPSTEDKQEARVKAAGQYLVQRKSISSEWLRRFEPLAGGIYRFRRLDRSASETKSEDGLGEPARYTGMVKSAFRPSDDATILPFFIPGNA